MSSKYRETLKKVGLLCFALVLAVGNIIIDPEPAKAASFTMRTGSYVGTGAANNTISGIGFQPDLVMIKASTTAGFVRYKTSVMPANMTFHMNNATAVDTSTAITLTATGFTTSSLAEINTINVHYHWVAYGGSDCSATGNFCVGTYTGGNPTPRTVTTGFQPALVINKAGTTANGTHFRTASMPVDQTEYFNGFATPTAGAFIRSITATGFTVGTTANGNGVAHYYIAFGATGNVKEGTYTGTGADNVSIASLGFKPAAVIIKNTSSATTASKRAVFSTTSHHGDLSSYVGDAVADAANAIQAMESGGFQRGSLANVNESGATHYWVAFGTEPSPPAGSGTFGFSQGSYTGTGAGFSITGLSFRPDVVIIKSETSGNAVMRTSTMQGDVTTYFSSAGAIAGVITSLDSNGFTLGTSTLSNGAGTVYHWQAFGNAYNSNTYTGATDFAVGSYYGSGIDNRNIVGVPFQPDLVFVKSTGQAAAHFRTSANSGDTGLNFTTSNASNTIQAINADGYQLGTVTSLNALASVYHWFAFKAGTNMTVGTYSGNSVNGRLIPLASFRPNLVWTKSPISVAGVYRPTSLTGDSSLYFNGSAVAADKIEALNGGGYTVGTGSEVNSSGTNPYTYVAWRETLPETLSMNIVDSGGAVVTSPSFAMSNTAQSFQCWASTGTIGSASQRLRISNLRVSASWSTSIAATGGPTARWANAGNTRYIDFNDASGCLDGADSDGTGGQLTINPQTGTIAPETNCANTGVTLGGSSQSFVEGSINNITLVSAAAGADTACYWDVTGISLSQNIPAEQDPGTYSINMTVTTVAS